MAYVGRYYTLSRPDWGYIIPGEMLGATFDAPTDHLWVHQFGFWGGRYTPMSGANVTARVGLYATSGNTPTTRLGYSDAVAVTAAMADSSSGDDYVANVNTVDVAPPTGHTFSGIPIASGANYHLAVLGTSGYLAYGMIAAARPGFVATHKYFYRRTGLPQPPPSPFGGYSSSYEGHPTIWADADINVKPNAPTGLTPSGSTLSTTPVMEAAFVDANTNRGDYLNQCRIQVIRNSDGVIFWDTTVTASEAERTADVISRVYGGTTLVRGTSYAWRCQMSDHFGAWSDWSAWANLTPAAAGTVTLNSTPTGRITTTTPPFNGRWTHQTSVSMKRVQVRLWNGNGDTVLQLGNDFDIPDIASSAAPGTLFTVAWASTGFATLAHGTAYQYDMQGYDGTSWSNWSNKRSFTTNAAPSVPTPVSPQDGLATPNRPLLEVSVSDADATAGSLTVYFEILDTNDAVLGTYTGTWHAGTQRYRLQTTSTHLPSYASRKWRAYAYDGFLYSGGVTSSGAATRSAVRSFNYAAVPSVTITAPSSPVTVSNPTVTWTTSGQVSFRVRAYLTGTTTVAYDSGTVVSGTASHVIPSGNLRNGTDYDLVVDVTNASTLTGTSSLYPFTVSYPPATQVTSFTASPITVGTDVWASAVMLAWGQTGYGAGVWVAYIIKRNGLTIAEITSPSQTSYTDYVPPSGVTCVYEITQIILVGIDTLESNPVTANAQIDLGGVVLVSIDQPATVRTALRYTNERDHGRTINEAVYSPANGALPVTVRSPLHFRDVKFEAKLFNDDAAPAATRRKELEIADGDGGTFCYRDNHGRKLFVTISAMTIVDHVPDWYVAQIELREESFLEGVADD